MQDKAPQTEQQLSRSLETAAAIVAERCFQDKAFGEKFLANPKAALAEKNINTGEQAVHAHQNDAHNWHIVLPCVKVREMTGKYTDEELHSMKDSDVEQVSGGEVFVIAAAVFSTAAVATGAAVGATAIGTHYTSKKKK